MTQRILPNSIDLNAKIMYSDYTSFLTDAISVHFRERIKSSHSHNKYGENWHGTDTFAEAVALATTGWPQGTALVAEMSAKITSMVTGYVKEQTMYLDTTTQYCWDMASAVAGVPQCGVNFSPDQEKKLVRIVVDFGASSSIDANVLTAKAATIASLVTALDYCNFDTEIVCAVNDGYEKTIQCAFMLKSAGTPLDINSIAFALGHAAFRRRIHFNWMEQYYTQSVYNDWIVSGSYGQPKKLVNLSGDITIDNAYHGMRYWTNPTTAAEWILSQLAAQGVTINA